jgi:hypothetical protein
MLRAACAELEAFNSANATEGRDPSPDELGILAGTLQPFLEREVLPHYPSPEEFATAWQHFTPELRQLALLEMRRRRAGTLVRPPSVKAARMQKRLVASVFTVALLAHFYDHLHFPGSWFLLVAALIVAVNAWLRYTLFIDSRSEQHAEDWRAISEGMRVQFFWAAAGLAESAAANYLERVRSELDWVRNTVSAWSLPFARWRINFDALPRPDRLGRLRAVKDLWLEGQHAWFRMRGERAMRDKHRSHKRTISVAIIATAIAVVLVVTDIGEMLVEGSHAHHGNPVLALLGISLGLFLASAERGLHAEHDREFVALQQLMAAAGRRLETLFAEAAVHLQATDAEATMRFDTVIEEVKRLFLEIGKEALDENADSLVLHRSGPIAIPAGG